MSPKHISAVGCAESRRNRCPESVRNRCGTIVSVWTTMQSTGKMDSSLLIMGGGQDNREAFHAYRPRFESSEYPTCLWSYRHGSCISLFRD
ncbi:hypothetical protein RSAG8_00829, partial [Rhizoctonia solani AG-8 WAC10335]